MTLNFKDIVVYTVLIGDNEGLNEQPNIVHSNLRHVCLTDDKYLTSNSWEIININKILPDDNHRSQRNLKVRPHLIFPNYKFSFYIDNTVLLLEKTEKFINMIIKNSIVQENDPFFFLPYHSFRNTLREEFEECAKLRLDDQLRIYEQLNVYKKVNKTCLTKKPYWGGVLLRNHNHSKMKNFSEIWFSHICRYSRRDQLSLIHCSNQANIKLKGFYLNNSFSKFHKWPIKKNLISQRIYQDSLSEPITYYFLENFSFSNNDKDNLLLNIKKRRFLIELLFPKIFINNLLLKLKIFIKKNLVLKKILEK